MRRQGEKKKARMRTGGTSASILYLLHCQHAELWRFIILVLVVLIPTLFSRKKEQAALLKGKFRYWREKIDQKGLRIRRPKSN